MKKLIKYLQDQAVQASQQKYSGSAYLSPVTKEPQQRGRHQAPHTNTAQRSPIHDPASSGPETPRSSNAQLDRPRDASGPAIPEYQSIRRNMTRHQYGQDHILQSYEIYIPELDASHLASDPTAQRYWVVYIHGGYFRDPAVTSSSFYPALSQLIQSQSQGQSQTQTQTHESTHAHDHGHHHSGDQHHHPLPVSDPVDDNDITGYIAGYASINYRLSPHLEKAFQDPNTTPAYELRNAQWPDHMRDVLTAIAHLQQRYGFGDKYLLVGHSVGATMAVLSTLARKEAFTMTTTPTMTSTPTTTTTPTPTTNTITTPATTPTTTATATANAGMTMTTTTTTTPPKEREREKEREKSNHPPHPQIQPPSAVLGVSGIYDFNLLHGSFPTYIGLTRNAIPNSRDEILASPACYPAQEYTDVWARAKNDNDNDQQRQVDTKNDNDQQRQVDTNTNTNDQATQTQKQTKKEKKKPTRALILAHSRDDGLVDWGQVEAMVGVFRTGGGRDGDEHEGEAKLGVEGGSDIDIENDIDVRVIEIKGRHNEVWSQGTELARVIRESVRVLKSLER